jgi:Domain of unknown function (DUF4386)
MDSTQKLARRAGLLYWLAGAAAPFAYLYVPKALLVSGDAVATAERVRASTGLLRAGIVVELFGVTVLVFAALALWRLFEKVGAGAARVLAAMMLVSVAISYLNSVAFIAPLVLVESRALAAALAPAELAAQVLLYLRLHDYGLIVNQIFWGLWLYPFGALVVRSRFIPRWLGYPLYAAGTGYVVCSLVFLLLPPEQHWIGQAAQALGIGELPVMIWMIFWGARPAGDAGSALEPVPPH